LIIDCIYNDLLTGRLDQKAQVLSVESTFGRDSRPSDIDAMVLKLEQWDHQLEQSQILVDQQILDCNSSVVNHYEKQVTL
jgi:COP9 signalosome complex subunit 7